MAVTVRGTDILFNDGTTQSTAATGASTAFGAVGTYAVLMMAVNTNLALDGTIAGSSLRYNYSANNKTDAAQFGAPGYLPFPLAQQSNSTTYNGGGTAPSGTWRKMTTGPTYWVAYNGYNNEYRWAVALYVRIS